MSQQIPPAMVLDTQPAAPNLKNFTGYQIFMIVILASLHFTIILDFMIISPIGDLLMKELTLSPAQFGSVVSAYAISAGVSGILAAGFADRFDRKKLLLFFYSGFWLGTLFCAFAWSYTTLFTARLVTGVFGGVMISIIMAIMTDVFELRQRGRVMGFVQMSFAASQILGIPIGIWLANQWGWHSTFYMVAGLALIIGILIIIWVKPLNAHLAIQTDKKPLQHLWHTVRKKEYHIGFWGIAMLSLGGFMLMPFSAPFLVNNVAVTQESLPLVFFFTGISAMVIMPLIGRLSDRFDKFRIFFVGSILASIMIVVYTHLTPIPLWWVIVINVILFMGIFSRMVPAMALHTAIPDPADRGAYMSITSSLQQLAGGFAAMFAGIVVVQESNSSPIQHFNSLGFVMVGVMAFCLILVWKMNRYVKMKELKHQDV
jgi:predicted MFS family arabinose efflux permease